MSDVKFDVLNARVTFKNVPLHSLSRFAFKDVAAATDAFKKIPGVEECIIIQTSSRVEIFTVSNLETDDSTDARRPEGKGLIINQMKETWQENSNIEQQCASCKVPFFARGPHRASPINPTICFSSRCNSH